MNIPNKYGGTQFLDKPINIAAVRWPKTLDTKWTNNRSTYTIRIVETNVCIIHKRKHMINAIDSEYLYRSLYQIWKLTFPFGFYFTVLRHAFKFQLFDMPMLRSNITHAKNNFSNHWIFSPKRLFATNVKNKIL